MKKVLVVVAFIGLAMTSCKKTSACVCKDKDVTNPGENEVHVISNATKKDATKVCKAYDDAAADYDYDCAIE